MSAKIGRARYSSVGQGMICTDLEAWRLARAGSRTGFTFVLKRSDWVQERGATDNMVGDVRFVNEIGMYGGISLDARAPVVALHCARDHTSPVSRGACAE